MLKSVEFKLVHADAQAPVRAHATDAGADLFACETVVIPPGETRKVDTGVCVAIPEGFEGQVRPRSGNAAKLGLTVLNSPGTIDSEYRGSIGVLIYNTSAIAAKVTCKMRIAQLVVSPVALPTFVQVQELSETVRGTGGFGSTGATDKPKNVVKARNFGQQPVAQDDPHLAPKDEPYSILPSGEKKFLTPEEVENFLGKERLVLGKDGTFSHVPAKSPKSEPKKEPAKKADPKK